MRVYLQFIKSVLLCVFMAALSGKALAQGGVIAFDHAKTGFDLLGSHQFVACESCHISGQFEGTPRDCFGCHVSNGRFNATPKTIDHIQSTNQCDACHSATAWEDVTRVDHSEVFGQCVSCHNDIYAPGKPSNHIPVIDDCQECHWDMSWLPAGFNHDVTPTDTCVQCHNNVNVAGKPADHINITSDQACSNCHTNTFSWAPVQIVDHDFVAGACIDCHNGQIAEGKIPGHIDSSNQCADCHTNTFAWAPVTQVDHSQVNGACISCHFAGNNFGAPFKGPNHIPASDDCALCHDDSDFPMPFGSAIDSVRIHNITAMPQLDNCAACHTTGLAPGQPSNHIAITPDNTCSACHNNFAAFGGVAPAEVDHDFILNVDNCVFCHTPGGSARPKILGHIPSTDNCGACHTTTMPFGAIMPSDVDHSPLGMQSTTPCRNCHGPEDQIENHPPDLGRDCSECHGTDTETWAF